MDQTRVPDGSKTLPHRRAMVDNQIRTFDVTDQRLLERFYTVPREIFLPASLASLAYSDAVLTVPGSSGVKRALLVPLVLARLIQGASIVETDRVLVVGDAWGYTAAIVAGLATEVVMLESDPSFVEAAGRALQALRLGNVTCVQGPLPDGDSKGAPFDVIIVAGAIESRFETLLSQLAPRGRLAAIQKTLFDGVRRSGKAVLMERFGDDVSPRNLFDSTANVLEGFEQPSGFVF
jgi:protein-L-isoaspartate(D-aspartate) O-methyltransferase